MDEIKELSEIKAEVSGLEKKAGEVAVTNQDEYAKAIDIRAKLKEIGSKIKNTKESITKPLNEALKNARALFAPVEEIYEKADSTLSGKLLAYSQKVRQEAAKEEARIAKALEDGKIKNIETAERRIEKIERVENTTHGAIGKATIHKIKKVRILNPLLLPREYLVPDLVSIRRDALGGKIIPGTEVYEDEKMY